MQIYIFSFLNSFWVDKLDNFVFVYFCFYDYDFSLSFNYFFSIYIRCFLIFYFDHWAIQWKITIIILMKKTTKSSKQWQCQQMPRKLSFSSRVCSLMLFVLWICHIFLEGKLNLLKLFSLWSRFFSILCSSSEFKYA